MDPINPIAGNPEALNQPPKPTEGKSSNNITVISMALFVIMSLGLIIFLYYQNQQLKGMLASYQTPAASPTPMVTADPTSNWKTYTNSKYGFAFKYPATYGNVGSVSGPLTGTSTVIQGFSDPTTVREGTDAPFDGFSIYAVTNTKALSFDNYVANEQGAIGSSPRSTTKNIVKIPVSINGINGTAMDFSATLRMYYFPLPDGKTVIELSRLYANQSFLPTFDQILSTFKFTSASPSAVPSKTPVSTSSAAPVGY